MKRFQSWRYECDFCKKRGNSGDPENPPRESPFNFKEEQARWWRDINAAADDIAKETYLL